VQLISLQRSEGRQELSGAGLPIVDFGDEVDTAHAAFMDTAALMKKLDLVITSDTSVPHLDGAIGLPVWVALPYVSDWRWMLGRGGGLGSVFEELKISPRELVAATRSGAK
jgi:hypothetical protein